jgi:hypothetical protein
MQRLGQQRCFAAALSVAGVFASINVGKAASGFDR